MICRIRHSKLLRGTVFITTALTLLAGCCGENFPGAKDIVAIAISPLNSSIQAGNTQQFSATGSFGLGNTGDVTSQVTWTSSDPDIASVGNTGLATGIAYGTVNISAHYKCCTTATAVLSVSSPTAAVISIAVTPTNPTIAVGRTQQFVATATYSDGTTSVITSSVRWSSNDSTIAMVSTGGVATGVSSGNVTISASSGHVSGSTAWTVP